MLCHRRTRRGVTIVECAVVYPALLILLIGLVVGAMGVFRYQQVASLAREAGRYASVHGYTYQQMTNSPAVTPTDIYNAVIQPEAVGLDLSRLTYSITWNPDNRQGGMVNVTISYQWIPEAFVGGVTLQSTSSMPVSY